MKKKKEEEEKKGGKEKGREGGGKKEGRKVGMKEMIRNLSTRVFKVTGITLMLSQGMLHAVLPRKETKAYPRTPIIQD